MISQTHFEVVREQLAARGVTISHPLDIIEREARELETTLAHAEEFIEHMGMSYRWAEWREGHNPSAPKEGSLTCSACGAFIAWEGGPPEDCLRCGAAIPAMVLR